MDRLSKIIANYELFRSEVPDGKYKSLDDGQNPEVLLITCSDSRICPSLFMRTEPGEVFIIRNAGNMVPSQKSEAKADLGTIQFAVDVLGVKDIIVCGHTDCGAVRALLSPSSVSALSHLKNWLCSCASTKGLDPERDLVDNVRTHVLNQIESLESLDIVQAKLAEGKIRLHAWVINLGEQSLATCDFASGQWQPIVPEKGSGLGLDTDASTQA